jgi:hypothetical protein
MHGSAPRSSARLRCILLLVLLGAFVMAVAPADAQTLLRTLDMPNAEGSRYEARFGSSLALADVNGDGKDNIAVGAPFEDVGGATDQGRAYAFRSAPAPLGGIAQLLMKFHTLTENTDGYTTSLVLNPDVEVDYPSAEGTLTYDQTDDAFRGHIDATGLLPSFPYQLKLMGKPSCVGWWDPADDWGNEQLGPEGFWWGNNSKVYNDYEEYDDCGHGDDPLVPPHSGCGYRREEDPHDFVPYQTEDCCYEGTLVFDGFLSDGNGNISRDFVADWSYPHAPPEDDRDEHPFVLPPGPYDVRFALSESAHNPGNYGGPSSAQWRVVLLNDNATFEIAAPPSVGGIAELPDVAGAHVEASASDRSRIPVPAGVAAALAGGVVALGGAAWYARRRLLT